jgi:hypothetical protein
MSFLLSYLLKFIGSPIVQEVVKNLIILLINKGKEAIPLAIEEIKRVAADSTIPLDGKFDAVFALLKSKFPDLGTSALNTIIEVSYNYLKTTKSV